MKKDFVSLLENASTDKETESKEEKTEENSTNEVKNEAVSMDIVKENDSNAPQKTEGTLKDEEEVEDEEREPKLVKILDKRFNANGDAEYLVQFDKEDVENEWVAPDVAQWLASQVRDLEGKIRAEVAERIKVDENR